MQQYGMTRTFPINYDKSVEVFEQYADSLYRGRCRNKFIQVCDDEINIMQDSSALSYCEIYNSRKTYLG